MKDNTKYWIGIVGNIILTLLLFSSCFYIYYDYSINAKAKDHMEGLMFISCVRGSSFNGTEIIKEGVVSSYDSAYYVCKEDVEYLLKISGWK